jgi:GntR family transcriptional repressor for pyruvate dehydrogenase complex
MAEPANGPNVRAARAPHETIYDREMEDPALDHQPVDDAATARPAQPGASGARPAKRPRTLAYSLVEDFQRRIRIGELRPGDKLPSESEIIKAFAVSRTVVRDAVSRLQAAGFVETHQGIGTFVLETRSSSSLRQDPNKPRAVDVFAALEVRAGVEVEAAGLAALRRTDAQLAEMRRLLDIFEAHVQDPGDTVSPDFRFHLQIAEATGNAYFVEVLTPLDATVIPRTRINSATMSSAALPKYLSMVNQEHEAIYRAIARGDSVAAQAAMRLHLSNSRERQLEVQRARGEPSSQHSDRQ